MVVDHTRSSVLFRASASSERVSGQVLHFTAQGPYQAVSLARASQLPDRLHPLFVFSRTLSRVLPVAFGSSPPSTPFPPKKWKTTCSHSRCGHVEKTYIGDFAVFLERRVLAVSEAHTYPRV